MEVMEVMEVIKPNAQPPSPNVCHNQQFDNFGLPHEAARRERGNDTLDCCRT